jgi:hypothetical protein
MSHNLIDTRSAYKDLVRLPKQENDLPSNSTGKDHKNFPRAGYGACSRCPCLAFEGSGHVCTNCGHNYDDHW